MNNYYAVVRSPNYLEHHGILGQKWGIRRFQNPDGSLTEEGRKRYGDILTKDQMNNMVKSYNKLNGTKKKINKNTVFKTKNGMYDHKGRKLDSESKVEDPTEKQNKKTDTTPKKPSEMTDEELKAINTRMQAEIDYKTKYAQLHPTRETMGRQIVNNLKDQLVTQIPAGIGILAKNAIANMKFEDDEKPVEPHTRITGVDPNKLSDKGLERYNARMKSIEEARGHKEKEDRYNEKQVDNLLREYGATSVEEMMSMMNESVSDRWINPYGEDRYGKKK